MSDVFTTVVYSGGFDSSLGLDEKKKVIDAIEEFNKELANWHEYYIDGVCWIKLNNLWYTSGNAIAINLIPSSTVNFREFLEEGNSIKIGGIKKVNRKTQRITGFVIDTLYVLRKSGAEDVLIDNRR